MADAEYGLLSGEPDEVESHAAKVAQVAEKIDAAVTALRKLQGLDGMQGKAIAKLSETAGKVADDIVKAKGRYVAAGAALAGYAPQLRQAKSDAHRAATQLEQLNGQLGTAKKRQSDAADAAQTASDDDAQQAQQQKSLADAHVEGLSSDIAKWQRAWHRAAQSKDDAGNSAADQVHDADQHDGLKDGWRDKISAAWHAVTSHVKDFLKSDLFDHLLSALDIVTQILGVVALVIAFIPGVDIADFGLGPVLLALTALDTAGHLAQDAAKGDGKAAIVDGVVGAVSIFGGGAVKVLAKNFVSVARPAAELAESGELTSGARGVWDVAEGTYESVSPLKSVLSKIGSRVTTFKTGLTSGAKLAKEIGADGVKDLKGAPFGWVVDGFKDPYAILGTSKETIEALSSSSLRASKMIPLSLAQGVVSAVKINEEREQVATALGLPENPFNSGAEE
ncbi:hypothetical protein GCM10022288_14130 [Gryllotalpicola kribbensis]|uniref:Uncharacterized protein n=1 Tax=Gryllotalpicola kribbensis TaxID=993084 RepID=A0ABP8AQI3_9MICO